MFGELFIVTSLCLLYAFYKWGTVNNDYFKKQNVDYLKPTFLFGNNAEFIGGRTNLFKFSKKLCNAFPNKVFGMFDFRQPTWVIRDPETIKRLTVKDFDHFEDHRKFMDQNSDDFMANSLVSMSGEKWRDMRATLSPAFTGSKMRSMLELVSECADDLTQQILKKMSGQNKVELEMKDTFMKYSNNVIATCAFGIKVNSFENPDNEFMKIGNIIQGKDKWANLRIMFITLCPFIAKIFKMEFLSTYYTNFFRTLVLNTIEERMKHNIHRPDLINILMEVRHGNLRILTKDKTTIKSDEGFATVEESDIGKKEITRKWTDNQLIAQCFIFFVAGFESISTLLGFLAYEICAIANVQEKLYAEILSINNKLSGKRIDYETLQKLKYMDQVVSEALRKWPAPLTDRGCVKGYTYDDGETKFHIAKGKAIWIPIYRLHHDPKYFPDPEKFDPERFSDDNKNKIVSGTYIPFGIGPRNCIGSRFALMEAKAIIYYLLLNFSLEPSKNSQIPLKMKDTPMGLQTEKGIYMDMKLRNS